MTTTIKKFTVGTAKTVDGDWSELFTKGEFDSYEDAVKCFDETCGRAFRYCEDKDVFRSEPERKGYLAMLNVVTYEQDEDGDLEEVESADNDVELYTKCFTYGHADYQRDDKAVEPERRYWVYIKECIAYITGGDVRTRSVEPMGGEYDAICEDVTLDQAKQAIADYTKKHPARYEESDSGDYVSYVNFDTCYFYADDEDGCVHYCDELWGCSTRSQDLIDRLCDHAASLEQCYLDMSWDEY